MRTSVEALEGNRVKLSVEVDDAEFQRDVDAAFKRIAREVRIPGFRPGKAPRRILEARLGADVGRQEALREALPTYYAKAVRESDVDVIDAPDIDITSGQEEGPVSFDAVVAVRPQVSIPGYGSLRVTVPDPEVTDDEVDAQIERLRSQSAELEVVGRPARDGDHVTIDIAGSVDGEAVEGLTADDYLYEVGSEAVVPELDANLNGSKVGDILAFDADAPDDDGRISFRILVKEVKEPALPDVDDEWANEASEFDTVEELRNDLRSRLGEMKRTRTRQALSDAVIQSLVDLVEEDPPEPLVRAEVERRGRGLAQRLGAQGISIEQYLEATGNTAGELSESLESGAVMAVKADLALRAVIDAQAIEADDDEVDTEIALIAERVNEKPAAVRRQLERLDDLEGLRSDIKRGKAHDWLVEHAEIVDDEGRPIDREVLDVAPSDGAEDAPDGPVHVDAPASDPTPENDDTDDSEEQG